jgi:hypothetical protein
MTVRFSNRLVAELYQPFWAAWQAGEFLTDASAVAGTHRKRGLAWLRQAGGVRPRRGRDLQGRYLSFAEREEIALARVAGESMRSIAARLGRSPSTISRELVRNADPAGRYRASSAHARAYVRASRPKPAKLVTNRVLRERVQADLQKRYSPEQDRRPVCARISPTRRRCGCRPRRSISRYTCRLAVRCVVTCTGACAPGERCGCPTGKVPSARTGCCPT